MRQQSERMSEMLNELLTLSRLETGEKAMQTVPVDVGSMLQDIVADATQLSQYDQHQIKLSLETDHRLLADVDELRSAVSNLVFNAVKYTGPECEITVTWSIENRQGVISVEDKGEGIAIHHLERLTERFYRVDKGRARDQGGTGLGLAIVKHVLQRHEAVLEIDSEIGEGSIFSCHFSEQSLINQP